MGPVHGVSYFSPQGPWGITQPAPLLPSLSVMPTYHCINAAASGQQSGVESSKRGQSSQTAECSHYLALYWEDVVSRRKTMSFFFFHFLNNKTQKSCPIIETTELIWIILWKNPEKWLKTFSFFLSFCNHVDSGVPLMYGSSPLRLGLKDHSVLEVRLDEKQGPNRSTVNALCVFYQCRSMEVNSFLIKDHWIFRNTCFYTEIRQRKKGQTLKALRYKSAYTFCCWFPFNSVQSRQLENKWSIPL